jgi:hypothetical protein
MKASVPASDRNALKALMLKFEQMGEEFLDALKKIDPLKLVEKMKSDKDKRAG